MAITPQKLQALATAMATFKDNVIIAFDRKLQSAQNANDANSLSGKSAADIVNDADSAMDTHANAANPHGVSVDTLNTYTEIQITGFLTDKIAQGVIPLTLVRVSAQMTTRFDTQWQFSTTDAEILLMGRYVKIAGKMWHNIAETLVPGTAYYLYAKINLGVVSLLVSSTKLPENNYCTMVGRFIGPVSTSETVIPDFGPGILVEKINGYKVSLTADGSAIPVSTNAVNQEPILNWV